MANTVFKIKEWDEETVSELDEGGKITRAHVSTSYDGDLEAEGELEYVMMYRSDGSADFIGYESVAGTLQGEAGSFVFEHRGYFKDGIAKANWNIVQDSGTGSLKGISGRVSFSEAHKEEYDVELNYEL